MRKTTIDLLVFFIYSFLFTFYDWYLNTPYVSIWDWTHELALQGEKKVPMGRRIALFFFFCGPRENISLLLWVKNLRPFIKEKEVSISYKVWLYRRMTSTRYHLTYIVLDNSIPLNGIFVFLIFIFLWASGAPNPLRVSQRRIWSYLHENWWGTLETTPTSWR